MLTSFFSLCCPIFLPSSGLWITVFCACLPMGGVQHCVVEFVVQQYFICSALYFRYDMLLWRWIHSKMWQRTGRSAVVMWSRLLTSEWFAKVESSCRGCEVGLIMVMLIMSVEIMTRVITSDNWWWLRGSQGWRGWWFWGWWWSARAGWLSWR